jgi:hypothetical protein
MRQAIVTKYHGPTNTKGSRVSAKAFAGKCFVSYDDDALEPFRSGIESAHARAALALIIKKEWYGIWVGGGSPDETSFCFVMVPFKNITQQRYCRNNKIVQFLEE